MSTNEASGLLKQAALDHEAAAKHHRKAAECHDHHRLRSAVTKEPALWLAFLFMDAVIITRIFETSGLVNAL